MWILPHLVWLFSCKYSWALLKNAVKLLGKNLLWSSAQPRAIIPSYGGTTLLCTLPSMPWNRFSSLAGGDRYYSWPCVNGGHCLIFSGGFFSLALGSFLTYMCWSVPSWILNGYPLSISEDLVCVLLTSLILCSLDSSHFGLLMLSALSTQLRKFTRFCWILPMHARIWKLAQGR